ncbi:hypothetical protein CSCA_2243 [Clostridium scatologenes]|uniref:Uncharacterized protein n=1 Tax=Clostridium scatologenes TaxID=1548 RepID=A0A0E3JYY0_CLOSL|nr:hypothetical protein CSCA_2243 [Clostridium scatologenes]
MRRAISFLSADKLSDLFLQIIWLNSQKKQLLCLIKSKF